MWLRKTSIPLPKAQCGTNGCRQPPRGAVWRLLTRRVEMQAASKRCRRCLRKLLRVRWMTAQNRRTKSPKRDMDIEAMSTRRLKASNRQGGASLTKSAVSVIGIPDAVSTAKDAKSTQDSLDRPPALVWAVSVCAVEISSANMMHLPLPAVEYSTNFQSVRTLEKKTTPFFLFAICLSFQD